MSGDPLNPPTLWIAAAAVRTADGIVHSLPPPARHCHVLHSIGGRVTHEEQGFLLSDGRFMRRAPALIVALEAGQLRGRKTHPSDELFSEDLW